MDYNFLVNFHFSFKSYPNSFLIFNLNLDLYYANCCSKTHFYYRTCVESCPRGTREFHSMCFQCGTNCESCTTVTNKELCQVCQDGYLMLEGENKCVASCGDGYYRGGHCFKLIWRKSVLFIYRFTFYHFLLLFNG